MSESKTGVYLFKSRELKKNTTRKESKQKGFMI